MPKITIQTTVKSSSEKVWAAWTTPEDINHWNAASDDWHNPRSTNDLRVGGKFSYRMEAKDGSVGFDFEGTYTKVELENYIAYIMADERVVSVTFEATDEGVKITETFDAEDIHSADMQRQGWQAILDHFAAYVEASK